MPAVAATPDFSDTMTTDDKTDDAPAKSLNTLAEAMTRGKNYREDFDDEVFGVPIRLVLKPVPDEDYYPFLYILDEKFDLTEEEAMGEMEEALEEADHEAMEVDLSAFDTEFIQAMEYLCTLGIDAEAMDGDPEMLDTIFSETVGGYAIKWAFEIMEVTGTLADAKKFRGGRNNA
ncbi:tail assembly chaperone [Halorubrum tailed virus 27]|uniref:Tail assembly chaperone n=1 Tax=Halorubrum tailed virus 27 TaxID=2878008 RepID=A0AAE8XYE3_9CAUD|nr:tail assembly chaperone [Halorubrum tailed virus 27]UBF22715.1 tail assembly chaperone [Halorubrum tailed virus 27]